MRVDSGKRFALGGRFRHGFTCLNKQALHYFQSVFPVFPVFPVLSLSVFLPWAALERAVPTQTASEETCCCLGTSWKIYLKAARLNAPSFARQAAAYWVCKSASHLAHGWRLQQTWSAPQQTPKWASHLCRADTWSESPAQQHTTTSDEIIAILLSQRGFAPVVVVDHCSQSLPTYQNHSKTITYQIVLFLTMQIHGKHRQKMWQIQWQNVARFNE